MGVDTTRETRGRREKRGKKTGLRRWKRREQAAKTICVLSGRRIGGDRTCVVRGYYGKMREKSVICCPEVGDTKNRTSVDRYEKDNQRLVYVEHQTTNQSRGEAFLGYG